MQSASPQTYLSKNALAAYTAKRQEIIDRKSPSVLKAEQIRPKLKVFQEDDDQYENEANKLVNDGLLKIDQPMMVRQDSDHLLEKQMSCEEVNSDELDGDLDLSDCESKAQAFRISNKQRKMQTSSRPARVFRQEIDTNVFKIGFSTLKDQAEIATGDPECCKKCGAFFNSHSKTEVKSSEVIGQADQQIWKCEFCNTENEVCLDEEEKPQTSAVNYIVEAAAQIQDKKAMGQKDNSVIFCMDQSGSMCCSQQIKGKFNIKGDKTNELKDLMKFSDGSDQFLDGERNVTYVSRLQCLQAAIG